MLRRLTQSTAPRPVVLIRLLAGAVFVSEGIQKFLFPDQLGVGRFLKIGLPMTLQPDGCRITPLSGRR